MTSSKSKMKTDFGAGLTSQIKERHPPAESINHEELSPASKALALGSYFISGCMAINASQFLGAPLYLINQDWYNSWIAFTKQSFGLLTMTMTQWWAPTVVRVSGDESVRGQLLQTLDGNMLCQFPERLVMIANHQIYTDWLYLWWVGYTAGMHGRIYIVLKESLKRIPIIGWGMQFSQFIFLKRNWEKDKPRLAAHLQKFNRAIDPMWLMIFPEGTNLAPCTREASQKWAKKNGIRDMKHQLLPRSTGLQFCLQQLRDTVDYVYDCTIAYEGVPRGQYAQDIFTVGASYFGGHPPKSVNMYWRRFPISSIPLDNSKAFDLWLRARWTEKDNLIEGYLRTGRFPADTGVGKTPDGKTRRGAGYITTEIKPTNWYEFLQIFAPVGLFALVLYMFYGALPKKYSKSIDKTAMVSKILSLQPDQIEGLGTKKLMGLAQKTIDKNLMELKKTALTQKELVITLENQDLLKRILSIQKNGVQGPETKQLMGLAQKYLSADINAAKSVSTKHIPTAETIDRQNLLNKIVSIQKNGLQGPESKQLMDLAQKYMGGEITGLNELLARQKKAVNNTPAPKTTVSKKPNIKPPPSQKTNPRTKPPSKPSTIAPSQKSSSTGATKKNPTSTRTTAKQPPQPKTPSKKPALPKTHLPPTIPPTLPKNPPKPNPKPNPQKPPAANKISPKPTTSLSPSKPSSVKPSKSASSKNPVARKI